MPEKLQVFWLLSEVSTAKGETIAFSRTEEGRGESLLSGCAPPAWGDHGYSQLRSRLCSTTVFQAVAGSVGHGP